MISRVELDVAMKLKLKVPHWFPDPDGENVNDWEDAPACARTDIGPLNMDWLCSEPSASENW
jgi:hypothetical protein